METARGRRTNPTLACAWLGRVSTRVRHRAGVGESFLRFRDTALFERLPRGESMKVGWIFEFDPPAFADQIPRVWRIAAVVPMSSRAFPTDHATMMCKHRAPGLS